MKNLVHEELVEQKEVEYRRPNIMYYNVPESRKFEIQERQEKDREFFTHLMDTQMNVTISEDERLKPVRLGTRVVDSDGKIKSRPLRFIVNNFRMKR